jgi:hypothetical protein
MAVGGAEEEATVAKNSEPLMNNYQSSANDVRGPVNDD